MQADIHYTYRDHEITKSGLSPELILYLVGTVMGQPTTQSCLGCDVCTGTTILSSEDNWIDSSRNFLGTMGKDFPGTGLELWHYSVHPRGLHHTEKGGHGLLRGRNTTTPIAWLGFVNTVQPLAKNTEIFSDSLPSPNRPPHNDLAWQALPPPPHPHRGKWHYSRGQKSILLPYFPAYKTTCLTHEKVLKSQGSS